MKTVINLLVNENLSPTLVQLANERGFVCSHVPYLGLAGDKDWQLGGKILDGDWTFITANSPDFRGPREAPGSKGEYADIALDAGLICINAPGGNLASKTRNSCAAPFPLGRVATHGRTTSEYTQIPQLRPISAP